MKTLMPYATLAGEVMFMVAAAALDGRDLPLNMLSQQERVVALHEVERQKWDEARLHLRARLPESELAGGPWSDVTCLAVLTEGVSNLRKVKRLSRSADGTWSGVITLARDVCRVRAELSVNVVATVDGVPGRIIGGSEENWLIDVQALEPVRRRELFINEVDFRQSPRPYHWLHAFKDAPWLVETSGDMPTVHLNTGFEGVTELLASNGGPTEKAVRGVVAAQIATEAWTAMFHSAVSDLEVAEDGAPEWPTGWRDWVLRSMLPDVLPDLSPTDALLEIHARRVESSGWNELQPRIQYAAARRARVAKNLGIAIRELDRSDEGGQ